ncbi:MAG: cation:proton antiporter, partial [Acidimicrobiales bacterium]
MLLALAVVLGASRVAGWAFAKARQPRVNGEIVAGMLLGPSLLGVVWPGALQYVFPPDVVSALQSLAQLGVVLFMFLVGVELDLDRMRGQTHRAVIISHVSIVAPVLSGIALAIGLYSWLGAGVDEAGFALFVGAAMGITAFPVLARVLHETGLSTTRIGVLTLTCAAVDDVTAWCLLAIVVAVVRANGLGSAARTVGLLIVFVVIMLVVVKGLLVRIGRLPGWFAITFGLVAGFATAQIGVHAIFGAFLAGVAMPRGDDVREQARAQLEPALVLLLLPVFFVVVGLRTRIAVLSQGYVWAAAAAIVAIAVVGKLGGSLLAARLTGESWRDAALIGVLMNIRGLTELVILDVGLQLGVITGTVFTAMVLMALLTTLG